MKLAKAPKSSITFAVTLGVLVGSVWFANCALLAFGAYLLLHTFRLNIVEGAPWDGLRAALRFSFYGGVLILLGASMAIGLFLKRADWLQFELSSLGSIFVVTSVIVVMAVTAFVRSVDLKPSSPVALTLAVFILALWVVDGNAIGIRLACLFALGVAMFICKAGWIFARQFATESLRDSRL